jgi:hypothetical protein
MMDNRFDKQPYEEFTASADYGKNFITGETITAQNVVAVDKDGQDVSALVVNQETVISDGTRVLALVRGGTEEASPYKLTFRCTTSRAHKWELDIEMNVIEI